MPINAKVTRETVEPLEENQEGLGVIAFKRPRVHQGADFVGQLHVALAHGRGWMVVSADGSEEVTLTCCCRFRCKEGVVIVIIPSIGKLSLEALADEGVNRRARLPQVRLVAAVVRRKQPIASVLRGAARPTEAYAASKRLPPLKHRVGKSNDRRYLCRDVLGGTTRRCPCNKANNSWTLSWSAPGKTMLTACRKTHSKLVPPRKWRQNRNARSTNCALFEAVPQRSLRSGMSTQTCRPCVERLDHRL